MTTTEATRWRREAEEMRQRLFYEDRDDDGDALITGPFSPTEDETLREMFLRFSDAEMAFELGRSIGDVARRLIDMQIHRKRRQKRWEDHEIETLRQYYGQEDCYALAKRLQRSYGSVYRKVKDTFG
jgi:hypothetical protein